MCKKNDEKQIMLKSSDLSLIFQALHFAFYYGGEEKTKGINSRAVFDLVQNVWEVRKDAESNLQLSQYDINWMFSALNRAIENGNPERIKANEVFELVKEVWDTRKNAEGDLQLSQFEISWMFLALNRAIENGNNNKKPSAKEVFDLVKEVFTQADDISRDTAHFMLDALKIDGQQKTMKLQF